MFANHKMFMRPLRLQSHGWFIMVNLRMICNIDIQRRHPVSPHKGSFTTFLHPPTSHCGWTFKHEYAGFFIGSVHTLTRRIAVWKDVWATVDPLHCTSVSCLTCKSSCGAEQLDWGFAARVSKWTTLWSSVCVRQYFQIWLSIINCSCSREFENHDIVEDFSGSKG